MLLWFILFCVFGFAHGSLCKTNSQQLTYRINEELNPLSRVGNIANDLDSVFGPPYKPNFFLEDEIKNKFDINYDTGLIRTKVKLDRENKSLYFFYIDRVADSSEICVTITVLDVNDNIPHFESNYKEISITEGAPPHKLSIGSATDGDAGNNTIAGFRLIPGDPEYPFNVTGSYSTADKYKLQLTLGINGTLDYETTQFYSLYIEVYDGGNPSQTATMQIDVRILDTNDNTPIFNQSKYSTLVSEDTTIGSSILEIHATDQDSGENARITYSIDKSTDVDDCFDVDPQSGVVTLKKMLDYETKRSYNIFAFATDHGDTPNKGLAVIEVEVANVNELPADINIKYNNDAPRILENATVGSFVARVSVSDPESPDTGGNKITVNLHGANGMFKLENTSTETYILVVASPLDRETKAMYNLTLTATDSGTPPLSATESFVLLIDDVNDNPPRFLKASYEAYVDEMSDAGSSVITITATDLDIGVNANMTYHIKARPGGNSDWFQVDGKTGLITTRGQVDCEVDSHPSFWLVATDQGLPALSSSTEVVVSVRDINDKEPTFDQSLYAASVPENQTINSCILQVCHSSYIPENVYCL